MISKLVNEIILLKLLLRSYPRYPNLSNVAVSYLRIEQSILFGGLDQKHLKTLTQWRT